MHGNADVSEVVSSRDIQNEVFITNSTGALVSQAILVLAVFFTILNITKFGGVIEFVVGSSTGLALKLSLGRGGVVVVDSITSVNIFS